MFDPSASTRYVPLTLWKGASPKEQIIEACRRDNVDLYNEVLAGMKGKSKEQVAKFFNEVLDTLGNHLLHICASYGSCKCSVCKYDVVHC